MNVVMVGPIVFGCTPADLLQRPFDLLPAEIQVLRGEVDHAATEQGFGLLDNDEACGQ